MPEKNLHLERDGNWLNAEVNAILESQPEGLMKWLALEGLELGDAEPEESWGYCIRAVEKGDCTEAAKDWVGAQIDLLKKVYKIHTHGKVCRVLAFRFARAKLKKHADLQIEAVVKLPPDYSDEDWVANHPGLVKSRSVPQVEVACQRFELINPCPSQEARNVLEHCSREPQYCNDFMKSMRTKRAAKEKADTGLPVMGEALKCDDLEKELLALVGEDDDIWP